MTTIASRSSTTASVSRKVRSPTGRPRPKIASTASANAMSVAAGIAQPLSASASPAPSDDRDVDDRRQRHAADGGDHGNRCPLRVPQAACDDLVLELDAHDVEEHREQAVGRPCGDAQVEVQRGWSDAQLHERRVRLPPRRVGPDERDGRGDEQQHAARRLEAEQLGDVRATCAGRCAGGLHGTPLDAAEPRARRHADQASRHTATRIGHRCSARPDAGRAETFSAGAAPRHRARPAQRRAARAARRGTSRGPHPR